MVKRKYLFIEGTKDTSNGNLREGFSKLIEQKAKLKMPTISMGDGKSQAVDKFLNSDGAKLLCDLDADEGHRENDLEKYNLIEKKDSVFYMIQEMESWFISQPDILDKFYGEPISTKLAKKQATLFSEPDKELQRLTKSNKKRGQYHKVNHGTLLLKMLDANKLYNEFSDFKKLIDSLK
ncbi:DUF4276 family protein [Flavobacterium solisilvae]|uniref:DUF4276 family protein n=1 Tax=Flavobacterium solisilvae TaxID=1852019 RepID=A0ABX1QRJ8_9FLAO|nr:DUF4276 family protein [Flavobacterium solisilvae]NMH24902.1 DUF4276 family protein [Flavobacterium solisilvae]